jgi:acyl-CoA thioester hydrolase
VSDGPAAPFEQRRRVEPADLDERAHVNNVVYLRWVQDVATAHWRAQASAESQAEIAWVALRHEIDYLHPALLDDEVVVRTWVGTAEGLSFERHTEVARVSDGRLLVRARTLWCPVDARTGRPRRVSAEVRARFSAPAAGSASDESRRGRY